MTGLSQACFSVACSGVGVNSSELAVTTQERDERVTVDSSGKLSSECTEREHQA